MRFEESPRLLSKIHVRDSGGSGSAVVLIHGWPLSSESCKAQFSALRAAGYRAIAYDRRGFGHSEATGGYDFDALADDLDCLLSCLNLRDATLVGFSVGAGEVARYVGKYGQERLRSLVFASPIPPCLTDAEDDPERALIKERVEKMIKDLAADRNAFFDRFSRDLFSVNGESKVTESTRQMAIRICLQSNRMAALACLQSLATEDFRADLLKVTVPALVIHGAGDIVVPFAESGARTHASIAQSKLVVLDDAPHGCNVSHQEVFNERLLEFLETTRNSQDQ